MIIQVTMTGLRQVIRADKALEGDAECEHPCSSETGFAAFHSRTAKPVWRFLYYMSGDRSLTDDLVQEAYLKFLHSAGRIPAGPQLVGYLYRIAANLMADHRRRSRLEHRWLPTSHSDSEFHEPVGDPQRAAVQRMESSLQVADLVSRLKSQDQLLVWLAYGEGIDHREIARRLSMKEKSIKVLLYRIRAKLTQLVRRGRTEL